MATCVSYALKGRVYVDFVVVVVVICSSGGGICGKLGQEFHSLLLSEATKLMAHLNESATQSAIPALELNGNERLEKRDDKFRFYQREKREIPLEVAKTQIQLTRLQNKVTLEWHDNSINSLRRNLVDRPTDRLTGSLAPRV